MNRSGIMMAVFMMVMSAGAARAQNYKMALGVRLSSNAPVVNNSITFKYFLRETAAVEALFSFGDPLALGLLVEKHKPLSGTSFNAFFGGGGYVSLGSPHYAGLQGVLGLDYKPASIPLNLSLDWKPELNLSREFSFEPAALGISARFTF